MPADRFLSAVLLLGIPLLVLAIVAVRIRIRRGGRELLLERMQELLRSIGAEPVADGFWKRGGRVVSVDVLLSPIFSRRFPLRLSTFCDSTYEFELKDSRNVPLPIPEELSRDPYYGPMFLRGAASPELSEYLQRVKDRLQTLVPARWGAVSKRHVELILSDSRFDPATLTAAGLASDLDALDALARVPLRRAVREGVVTYREGFERDFPAWHWTPEQRKSLPRTARRAVISYHLDNAYLHTALVEFFSRLAGDHARLFLTETGERSPLSFLRYAFGDGFRRSGNFFVSDVAEAPVAADQYLDGAFFQGFLSTDGEAALAPDFRDVPKYRLHEIALSRLDRVHFYARRLFDDENSWFSGEYEILSCALSPAEIREAAEEMAVRHGAKFVELDRRFSPKLLKEDRLEMTT